MEIREDVYIKSVSGNIAAVKRLENILFSFPSSKAIPQNWNCRPKSLEYLENKRIESENNMTYTRILLETLQRNSKKAVVYGANFKNDCFNRQGVNAYKFMRKKGKIYELDLTQDIWTGCESVWMGDDKHLKEFPHTIGDCYFFVSVKKMCWKSFFSTFSINGAFGHLKASMKSRSGFDFISDSILEDKELAIISMNRIIRADPEVLERLTYLSMAYNRGMDFSHLIFPSADAAQVALDFSNSVYEVRNEVK
ncbi:MAG: hypothetical protein KGO49_03535 [Gammaproteobacteria bacterium]|nr:hypothetical protein [Gammaproteobacteria bacterium]